MSDTQCKRLMYTLFGSLFGFFVLMVILARTIVY